MSGFPAPLTVLAMNTLFQSTTISTLGLPDGSFNLVRVDWQNEGQPFQKSQQDVVYLRCVEEDDVYNRLREITSDTNPDQTVTQAVRYTRVWRVDWTLYGATSFDNARKLRSALWTAPLHDALAAQNLYWVTEVQAPQRVPEFFSGKWRERVDFSARFNEAVVESNVAGTATSVQVVVENAEAVLADFTVTKES